MIGALARHVLWVEGGTWVRCEDCEYFIGSDDLATHAQRQMHLTAVGGSARY
jgi:hypothetical protein